jgi:hypothetical protein
VDDTAPHDVNRDDFTLDSARDAAARDELGDWVAAFLRSPGSDNAVLADELRRSKAAWHGPVCLPFDELQRLAGPPDQPALAPLGEDDLETVEEMDDSIEEGWEPPPLVVSYCDGEFTVEDGNHRIEGLRRAGRDDYWSVVGFDDEDQRDAFVAERSAGSRPSTA